MSDPVPQSADGNAEGVSSTPRFGITRRGYDRGEVDEYVASCRAALTAIAEENRTLRAAGRAQREQALIYADTARQRDELQRLRHERDELRAEVASLLDTRTNVLNTLAAMATTLRAWLAAHERNDTDRAG